MAGALIFNGSGVDAKPALINPGGTEQWGTEGDGHSVEGSVFDADTCNKGFGEISTLIQGLGLTLDMTVTTQLLALLQNRGQNLATFGTPGTYAYTVPENVFRLKMRMWGGGGAGGQGNGDAGGGGTGGGYSEGYVNVVPGTTITVNVGGGGVPGGANAGDTIITMPGGSTYSATGGSNGQNGVPGGHAVGGPYSGSASNAGFFNWSGTEGGVGDSLTAGSRTGEGGEAFGGGGGRNTLSNLGGAGHGGFRPGSAGAGGAGSSSGGAGGGGLVIFDY